MKPSSFLLLGIPVLGYWVYTRVARKQEAAASLQYQVRDIKIQKKKTSLWNIRFLVKLAVKNITSADLSIDRMEAAAFINGKRLAYSVRNVPVTIKGDGEAVIDLEINVGTLSAGMALFELLKDKNTPIAFEFKAWPMNGLPPVGFAMTKTVEELTR